MRDGKEIKGKEITRYKTELKIVPCRMLVILARFHFEMSELKTSASSNTAEVSKREERREKREERRERERERA